MGFFKKGKVPNELPDLAIGNPKEIKPVSEPPKPYFQAEPPRPLTQNLPITPKFEPQKLHVGHTEIAGEDYLEFTSDKPTNHLEIKKQINESFTAGDSHKSFFDQVLQDINGEIRDLGKLENWYNDKFLPQDVVSNMRDYWEGNKADMIIKSFGAEYRQKINEKIKRLQELEADWREVYFRLIKKEEEMKKEERSLKEILSEFVELCKRRKSGNEK